MCACARERERARVADACTSASVCVYFGSAAVGRFFPDKEGAGRRSFARVCAESACVRACGAAARPLTVSVASGESERG